MKHVLVIISVIGVMLSAGFVCADEFADAPAIKNPRMDRPMFDANHPMPRDVEPEGWDQVEKLGVAPKGAVVLFDGAGGSGMKAFAGFPIGSKGGVNPSIVSGAWPNGASQVGWVVKDGVMEVTDTGHIATKNSFGDVRLHLEYQVTGEDDGNSGIYFAGRYELGIMDSYRQRVVKEADKTCASIFSQSPPMVNACRKPGEWQSYDVIWKRPRFNAKGELVRASTMTVRHNGVLVHDERVLSGPTTFQKPENKKVDGKNVKVWKPRLMYAAHGRAPLVLQCHGDVVRFRNVWLVDLEER